MKICPDWKTCTHKKCLGYKPYEENHECGLGHGAFMCRAFNPCIKIPNMWIDKGAGQLEHAKITIMQA